VEKWWACTRVPCQCPDDSPDPKNPNILLALFDWSIQKTEINDARAWYNALAADNPTAVNPPFQPLVQTLSVSKVQPLLSLINLELALSNFPQVEALFARALKGPSGGITAAADVSVWSEHKAPRRSAIQGR